MKKEVFGFAMTSLLLTFILTGCIKDTVKTTFTYTMYQPVFKTTAAVRADIKSNAAIAIQQPGKLYINGNYIFLNEVDKGIHVIDNSNPAQPKNVAFIDIPGNVDLAVKGNTLYADLYTDLVTIDITNPLNTSVKKIFENVFPERYYSAYYGMDSNMVIVDWIRKDTTVTEKYTTGLWKRFNNGTWAMLAESNSRTLFDVSFASSAKSASPTAMGGSMARFAIVQDRLYTVGIQDLSVFNIASAAAPVYETRKQIGFNIETIFPFKDKLFIGSTNGMFIYSIANPDQPSLVSQFTHVQSCDPVIADEDHAYVTLRSGTTCNGFTNQLEVLNIANLLQPFLIKTYPMSHPFGLSKDGNLLFICDGTAGLKIYDASVSDNLVLLKTISGIETYDVIAYDNHALVVAKDGLYQFDYSDRSQIKQLSKLSITR